MSSREITKGRLRAALQRVLEGQPQNVKKHGKLTLNKINNEARLGRSYIHKFKDFIEEEANPAIESFNKAYDPVAAKALAESEEGELTNEVKLKRELKAQERLKKEYKEERDELKVINQMLEEQNSSLMFRIYELQQELAVDNVVSISKGNQN